MFTLTLTFAQVFGIGFLCGIISFIFAAGLVATITGGGRTDGKK